MGWVILISAILICIQYMIDWGLHKENGNNKKTP